MSTEAHKELRNYEDLTRSFFNKLLVIHFCFENKELVVNWLVKIVEFVDSFCFFFAFIIVTRLTFTHFFRCLSLTSFLLYNHVNRRESNWMVHQIWRGNKLGKKVCSTHIRINNNIRLDVRAARCL